MKKAIVAGLLSILFACTGDTGPQGPEGPEGVQGPQGDQGEPALVFEVAGTVADAAGTVGAGVPVALVVIDDSGSPIAPFGGTLTDGTGAFSISVDDGVAASTRLAVVAIADTTIPLMASLSTTADVAVDPVSTGVLAATILITSSPDGRTLEDYTPEEMIDLYTMAQAVVTDPADPDTVLQDIIDNIGGQVADYSEGAIEVTPPITVTPPADSASPINFPYDLVDVNGYMYDITASGQINDGTAGGQSDAYDRAFRLLIDGTEFISFAGGTLEDGDEVVVGPVLRSGLQVTRKIHLDPGDSIVRYTEILDNPGGSPITVEVEIAQHLGSDELTQILGTSTGDLIFSTDDRWVYVDDDDPTGTDPITAFWFGTSATAVEFDLGAANVTYTWSGVTVPPGERVTFIHFGFMAENPADVVTIEAMLASLPPLDGEALPGMTQQDLDANMTFSPGGIVLGGAGSVASFAQVTTTNQNSGNSVQGRASGDGSFVAPVGGVIGDPIHVTASDGTDVMLTL